ncbi:hypothetical protein CBER1_11782 [Cercospora berteroae]|uniref:Uncharacterized protein n=1 Tax=Cercospora berteroae TaxID=357750 RepID=A0A2S6BWW0_9PEZI|nr:hypothetical protein CBER1_11782 [Cercospora berteroae]
MAGKGNAEKEVVKNRVFTDSYPIEDEEALNAAKSRGYDKLGNAGIMAKMRTKHQYLAFYHLTASDNLQGLELFVQEWVFRLKTHPSPASTTGYRETSKVPNAPSSSRKRRPGNDASRYGDPAVPASQLALVQGQHHGFLFCRMLPNLAACCAPASTPLQRHYTHRDTAKPAQNRDAYHEFLHSMHMPF